MANIKNSSAKSDCQSPSFFQSFIARRTRLTSRQIRALRLAHRVMGIKNKRLGLGIGTATSLAMIVFNPSLGFAQEIPTYAGTWQGGDPTNAANWTGDMARQYEGAPRPDGPDFYKLTGTTPNVSWTSESLHIADGGNLQLVGNNYFNRTDTGARAPATLIVGLQSEGTMSLGAPAADTNATLRTTGEFYIGAGAGGDGSFTFLIDPTKAQNLRVTVHQEPDWSGGSSMDASELSQKYVERLVAYDNPPSLASVAVGIGVQGGRGELIMDLSSIPYDSPIDAPIGSKIYFETYGMMVVGSGADSEGVIKLISPEPPANLFSSTTRNRYDQYVAASIGVNGLRAGEDSGKAQILVDGGGFKVGPMDPIYAPFVKLDANEPVAYQSVLGANNGSAELDVINGGTFWAGTSLDEQIYLFEGEAQPPGKRFAGAGVSGINDGSLRGLGIGVNGGTGLVNVSGNKLLEFADGSLGNIASEFAATKGLDVGANGGNGVVNLVNGSKGLVLSGMGNAIVLSSDDPNLDVRDHPYNLAMRVGLGDGGTGEVNVSGAGTTLNVGGWLAPMPAPDPLSFIATRSGLVQVGVGGNSTGRILLSEGGVMRVGTPKLTEVTNLEGDYLDFEDSGYGRVDITPDGRIELSDGATGVGALHIGGRTIDAADAKAAGRVYAGSIDLKAAVGSEERASVVFNHRSTESDPYVLDTAVQGNGQLLQVSGYTRKADDATVMPLGLTGRAVLMGGTFNVGHNNALGGAAGMTVVGAGDGILEYDNGINLANSVLVLANENLQLSVPRGTATQSGVISGSGDIEKIGTGRLNLTATNTLTGDVNVSGGTLGLNKADTIAAANVLRVTGSAVADAAAAPSDVSVKGIASASGGTITLGANDLIITNGQAAVDDDGGLLFNTFPGRLTHDLYNYAGKITGSGGLTLQGSSTQVLSGGLGVNTYSGATTIGSGTLIAGARNAFSSTSTHDLTAGGLLQLNGFSQEIGNLNNLGGTVNIGSLNRATTLKVNGNVANSGHINLRDGMVGDRLVVTDDYTANGGSLYFDASLTGSGDISEGGQSQADMLIVEEDIFVNTPDTVYVNGFGSNYLLFQSGNTERVLLISE